jgi:hypothetical protein
VSIAWDAAEEMLRDLVGPNQSDTARRVAHDHLVSFARQVLRRIALISEDVGQQAGVGGMETAGAIISYLAGDPIMLEPLLRGGIFELPADWMQRGRLTWHGRNGKIWHPEQARRAAIIKNLKRSAS